MGEDKAVSQSTSDVGNEAWGVGRVAVVDVSRGLFHVLYDGACCIIFILIVLLKAS